MYKNIIINSQTEWKKVDQNDMAMDGNIKKKKKILTPNERKN